jgi:hypothetical protein
MGCIGLSHGDFCRCTPSEFKATYDAWAEMRQADYRTQWERTRMTALCSIQPHSSKSLRPQDVMAFPWDGEEGGGHVADTSRRVDGSDSDKTNSPQLEPELSRGELMSRYREAARRAGYLISS